MAVGDTADHGWLKSIVLAEGVSAANGAPSGSAGIDCNDIRRVNGGSLPRSASVYVYETAGSGTLSISYLRMWARDPVDDKWCPTGPGADADKGKLNDEQSLGETGTNELRHVEEIDLPAHAKRLYLELGTIGGTTPSFKAILVWAVDEGSD